METLAIINLKKTRRAIMLLVVSIIYVLFFSPSSHIEFTEISSVSTNREYPSIFNSC